MCGFAGLIPKHKKSLTQEQLLAMGRAIIHRGPDSEGAWISDELGVGLVHRRLAIQDLSELGHQPMHSSSDRYVIAFNGEVYNFKVIAKELIKLGHTFNGHSDTEVLLAAFEEWGVEAAIQHFAGMFAIALVDKTERRLHLIRDRLGEKPLYYGWGDAGFVFASELKAIKKYRDFRPEVDRGSLMLLLRHNFIPAPHTIYSDVYKLMPGSFITLDLDHPCERAEANKYWNETNFHGAKEKLELSENEWTNRIEHSLTEIISDQMISDAPLGAFLSGGVDSSTVVALMQKQSIRPIKTFTIGFHEAEFNEAIYAKQVAEYLGTEHHELYVSADDAMNVVEQLPKIYDEPFADSSQLPTLLLSKMTSDHVTVALSGDGGDEIFCGYSRYFSTVKNWSEQRTLSCKFKNKIISSLPTATMASLAKKFIPRLDNKSKSEIERRIMRKQVLAKSDSLSEYYRQAISYQQNPQKLVIGGVEPEYSLTNQLPTALAQGGYEELMWRDLNCYLPDDILVKVDRAAMANSLETRVPMLDHRFIEMARSIPVDMNVSGGVGKQLLRNVLYRHVPRELIERPKQGFAVPLAEWLRGPLRDWAETLLSAETLDKQGYLNSAEVRQLWRTHLSGLEDYSFLLWGVLMFQAWLEE